MSATSQIQNVSRTASVEFTSVMDDFKSRLTDEERRSFAMTKLEDLEIAIASIQRKQATQKRLQGLRRLEVFLEGMKEYDKLISVFLNSSPILAFVWVSKLDRSGIRISRTMCQLTPLGTDEISVTSK